MNATAASPGVGGGGRSRITDEAGPRGPPTEITSTYHHPYGSETRRQWVDAGELTPNAAAAFAVTTHNLTVDDFRTWGPINS
ncbi:hypothetical protein ACWGNM_01890 [Streptomyces sp. NPDC055796]